MSSEFGPLGSKTRTIHINLRELELPELGGEEWPPAPFAFSPETRRLLAAHLPTRAVGDLYELCILLSRNQRLTGADSKANAPSAVSKQLKALLELSDVLGTVLRHIRWGHAGELLARPSPDSDDPLRGRIDYGDVLQFRGRVLDAIAAAGRMSETRPRSLGRPRSAAVNAVAWIAAITAAHGLHISASPEAPFMQMCNCIWRDFGRSTEATHSVRCFVAALKAGRINVMSFGAGRRAYRLESDARSKAGYRVTKIRDWRDTLPKSGPGVP